MKTAKFLMIGAGLVSLVAGAIASSAKHLSVIYRNDTIANQCTVTVFSVTTVPNGQFVTTTLASVQPITNTECDKTLTLYKGL